MWGKKEERKKKDHSKHEDDEEDNRIKLIKDIEKIRKRREERENEVAEMERIREDEQRLRESLSYENWVSKPAIVDVLYLLFDFFITNRKIKKKNSIWHKLKSDRNFDCLIIVRNQLI